jgi:soluble lytic murein transglycosylase-like protein
MKRRIAHAVGSLVLGVLVFLPVRPTSAYTLDRTQMQGLAAIRWAAAHWHVSVNLLSSIAWRESRYEPWARNRYSGASGLFQFMPGTFYSYAPRIGEFRSIFNPYANANVAAYMFKIGLGYAWNY